jgi:lipopolysaccharide transport system permease protein
VHRAGPLQSLWHHRALAYRLAARDVAARWKGSYLGPLWTILTPLFLLGVYTFVFGTVLKGRWPASDGTQPPFALVLLSGLVLVQLFGETVNVASGVIRGNVSFVKQVLFPLEILPFVSFLVALFHAAMTGALLLVFYAALYRPPPLAAAWLPLLLLPVPLVTLGVAWFVAALGAYMRDTAQLTAVFVSVMMFLSPVFYAIESVPERLRFLIAWNPLTPVIVGVRSVLFDSTLPPMLPWFVALAVSAAVFHLGFLFFRRTREGFADVI